MVLKLVPPLLSVCVPEVPSKVTVFEPGVKVPPVWAQFPDTVKAPLGAVRVPEDKVTAPFTSTVPVEPVKVAPETVTPPLKVLVLPEVEVVSVPLPLAAV